MLMQEIIIALSVYDKMIVILERICETFPELEIEINHYLQAAKVLKEEMLLGQRDAELTADHFEAIIKIVLDNIDYY